MNLKTIKNPNIFGKEEEFKKISVPQILFSMDLGNENVDNYPVDSEKLKNKFQGTRVYNETKYILYTEISEEMGIRQLLELRKYYLSSQARESIYRNKEYLKPVVIRVMEIFYDFIEKNNFEVVDNIAEIKVYDFPIVPIEPEKLKNLRRNKDFFAMCFNSKYYYGEFPEKFSLLGTNILFSGHQCNNCLFQWPIDEKYGGCEKVQKLEKSIEEFPYINYGYETHNCLIVSECFKFSRKGDKIRKFTTNEIVEYRKHLL